MHDMDFLSEDVPSIDSPHNGSPGISDNEDSVEQKSRSRRRKGKSRRRDEMNHNISGFIDLDYWEKEVICCGTIFRGQNDEIMIDHSHIKPCQGRIVMCKARALTQSAPTAIRDPSTTKGAYSDNSSDSGYDDYSNQSVAMSPDAQRNHVTEQENVAATRENRVVTNLVTVQENLVMVQGNRIITPRKNLVSKQVADLMCHETIFKRQEVREMHLSPDLAVSDMIINRFHDQETAVRN